jgi:hypothetical protein
MAYLDGREVARVRDVSDRQDKMFSKYENIENIEELIFTAILASPPESIDPMERAVYAVNKTLPSRQPSSFTLRTARRITSDFEVFHFVASDSSEPSVS